MKKILNEKNLLLLISLLLITFVFINFVHNKYENFKEINNGNYYKLNNFDFKKNINLKLKSDETYERILEKECEVTGDMHDRHKVRWLKASMMKNIFQISDKINSNLPYYVNILIHSLIIFLTLLFIDRTFQISKDFIIFFLLYITFIFQNYLGPYSDSIFEMFFASAALYASKKKNIYLFLIFTTMAVLNRESGFIILLFWLIFNNNYKIFFISSTLVFLIFLIVNLKTVNCMINPKFFIPFEPQKGQVNVDNFQSINFLSLIKLFLINYIIPFGVIFYNILKNKIKNKIFIFIVLIYLLTFLVATPFHHMAVKLIILPLIILSFYLPQKKIN